MTETSKRNKNLVRVEIVSAVHNRREITLQCLKSLSRINQTGLDVHIIIVDDGSTDGTSEAILENFPEVEIVRGDGNLWFTAGTNRGIEAALKHNPDYILTINDDAVFDAEFLQWLVKTCQKHPRSVVGSLLLLWDTPHKVFQVAPKWDFWGGGYRHWVRQTVWTVPNRPWKVELIVGNCVLFPAQVFKECGLMNEKKFPHYGDAEFTPRLRRKGWKLLIEPRSRVFCQPNTIPPSVSKMPLKKKLRIIFGDKGNGNSFYFRFWASVYGAPNLLQGLLAVPVFYGRWLLGKNIQGGYAYQIQEKPLAEIYADKIVE